MEVPQIYNSFKEWTSFKINNYLDETLGLYGNCIEPLNVELLQDESDSQGIDRINILFRFILWDKLFHDKYDFDEKKLLGSYKRKAVIDALLPIINNPDKYKNSYNALIDIFGRWPQIRDLIFHKQKAELDKCTTTKDYISFVEKNPYSEYFLYAKYRISQLNNAPFDEAKIAIEKFRQSDILPIEQLKSLFHEVNGIHFMWKGSASESDNNTGIKDVIIDLISNCNPSNISNEYLLQNQPIDYFLLRKILLCQTEEANDKLLKYELYLHDCQKKENNDKIGIISSKEFFISFLSMLNGLVSGVKFSLPQVDILSIGESDSMEYLWADSLDNSGKQVVFRCRDGKIFPNSKGFYAGCKLMLHTKLD